MRLLLDECVTHYLKRELAGHEVSTVDDAGLKGLKNGELLRAASGNFDVLVTVDKNIVHQQNLKLFRIAVLILLAKRNDYESLRPLVPQALQALERIRQGDVVRVGEAREGESE